MKNLHLTILRELASVAPLLKSRETLHADVTWAVVPQPTWSELDAALSDLEKDGYITAVRNPLIGLRYAITDSGRAALQS